ncbi:MAG: sulfotransferase family 2 domain-containing protein [Bacteroidota bacterium]
MPLERSHLERLTLHWDRWRGVQHAHLLHVGKTGGTALKATLENARGDNCRLFLHGHRVTLGDIPEGDGFFFFVRDPVSRFASGFYSRQRQGQPRYFYRWTRNEATAFERFQTPDELARALSDPDAARRAEAEHAMRSIQHVRDPYRLWFGDDAAFRSRADDLLFVGSQEHLREDFQRLKAVLGLPEDLQLPSSPKEAHRRPEHLDVTLSDEARANLAAWYAEDYVFLDELADRHDHLPRYTPVSAPSSPEGPTQQAPLS